MRRGFAAAAVLIFLLPFSGEGLALEVTPDDEAVEKKASGASSDPSREAGIGREDPFAPLKRKTASRPPQESGGGGGEITEPLPQAGHVHLEGIIWSPRQPHAVINEMLVGVEETVAGWKVVRIAREEVFLVCGAQKISLNMNEHLYTGEKKSEKPKEKGNGS